MHVDNGAIYVQPGDPSHSINGTHLQMWGEYLPPMPSAARDGGVWSPQATPEVPPMDGFVRSYSDNVNNSIILNGTNATGAFIMHAFDPSHVPVITALANEFALFDGWHASVPGPTEVNRCFAWSATSDGMATNDHWKMALGMPQRTVWETLDNANSSWAVFFTDFPSTLIMNYPRWHMHNHFFSMSKFYKMAAAGTLPAYSFLEPRYYDDFNKSATDQHPDHDVAAGERHMSDVYTALRNGKNWNKTALLITYDEHGGFPDHVPPPVAPSPDGKVSANPPFNFTRFGLRVPAVLVSPYVKKGTVVHAPTDGTHWDHSSIPATVRKLFAPSEPFLTRRDASAATFDSVLTLDEPRTDCPTELPFPVTHRGITPLPPLDGHLPLTDLQKGFAMLSAHLNGEMVDDIDGMMEREGAALVTRNMERLLARAAAEAK